MWPTGPDGCPLLGSGPPPAGRGLECAIFAGASEQFHAGANSRSTRIFRITADEGLEDCSARRGVPCTPKSVIVWELPPDSSRREELPERSSCGDRR